MESELFGYEKKAFTGAIHRLQLRSAASDHVFEACLDRFAAMVLEQALNLTSGNRRLIVHCGACMLNRREMLKRILQSQKTGVPNINYGLSIASSLGILDRALDPFPGARSVLTRHGRRFSLT